MPLIKSIRDYFSASMKNAPLRTILILALVLRLVAAVFAKGYGMHDDHFSVIEASQSWADGTDYNNWLPSSQTNPVPQGHSFFYVGIHFLIFSVFKFIGITNPDIKMLIIRILHALLSLLVVAGGYKIALKISNQKSANLTGILLATFWFMPFLSVRNLVEIVAIPLLIVSILMVMDAETKKKIFWTLFFAGFIGGLAVSVRFQALIFIGGIGLVLLIQKKWLNALIFGIGALVSIVLIQGVVDYFIWHRPFAEFTEYIIYNLTEKNAYGTNNYLMYPEVILGMLVPPISLFLFFGFLRTWKKYLLIFLPTILFFAFHEYFVNKQERFILTILPFIIITGVAGWNEFVEKSAYWAKHPRLLKGFWTFFWSLNILLLAIISTAYSKKSRCEAMLYLYPQRANITSIILDDNNRNGISFVPLFYLGKWVSIYQLNKNITVNDSLDYVYCTRYQKKIQNLDYFKRHPELKAPDYVMFYDDTNLNSRVDAIKSFYKTLTFEKTIEPSNLDKFMRWINPVNVNQTIYIYKIK